MPKLKTTSALGRTPSPAERKPLSWEPRRYVHEGVERYCAPACGHHCTVENWCEAQTFAGACARDLGDGWIPRVHENMGWHSSARFEIEPFEAGERALDVYVSVRTDPIVGSGKRRVRGYWASVSGAGSQWTGDGATAPDALAAAVAMGVELASRQLQCLTALAGKEAEGVGSEATRLVRVLAAAIEARSEVARTTKTKRDGR